MKQKIFIWSWSWSEHKICSYQSTLIYNFFLKNWYELVSVAKNADLIVLNWYPFEEFEEKINLLTISYYLKKYPESEVLLIGSIPWMMTYMSEVDRIIMIWLKDNYLFDKQFEHTISIKDIEIDKIKYFMPLNIESLNIDKYGYDWENIESNFEYSTEDLNITLDDVKAWIVNIDRIWEYDSKYNYLEDKSWEYPIWICTWCWGYCSYCDIRNVAWFVKSDPIEKILEKIRTAISLWYKLIHFIDEDSASYWLDQWVDFAELLNRVNKIEWDFKIVIFYFEPSRLEVLFDKVDTEVWHRIKNFCVPIQTTSQRIVKLMNRNYNISNVIDRVKKIKKINPNIYITTQVIYWFPTETFEEFKDYFRLLSTFEELWFWYYSDRKKTKAINFIWKIDKLEMSRRLVFLWKIKSKYEERVFDKHETLKQWLDVFKRREF